MNQEIGIEQFFKKYYSNLLSYCIGTFSIDESDAEDIIQNAFIALYSSWDEFENHSEPVVLAWIRKTIKYMAYSYNRKKAREPVMVELQHWATNEVHQQSSALEYIDEKNIDDNELYRAYIDAIRSELTLSQQAVFDCIIVNKHDVKTAASFLNMKENTVKVSLKRLRRRIREKILPKLFKNR